MRCSLLCTAAVVAAAPLSAQTAESIRKAVATITPKNVAHQVGIIADDSMRRRDTPSRGLEITARYIADQFEQLGLTPGGKNGSWLQWYPISGRWLNAPGSCIGFYSDGHSTTVGFSYAAYLAEPVVPDKPTEARAVLVAGPHTAQSAQQADVGGKVVLYVPQTGTDLTLRRQVVQTLSSKSQGVVMVSDQDSAAFAEQMHGALSRAIGAAPQWAAQVWPMAKLQTVFTAVGLNLAQARAASAPVVQDLPSLMVRLMAFTGEASAPNVVGILEGSDPKLKDEYIVISAPMDNLGISADGGSGTVGVVELAKAFSQPGARPRRSIIFVTVSGKTRGLWGSEYFIDHPPVPLERIVANINLDMIGRRWTDTVVAIGKAHSDLDATLQRVATAHPELRMAVINDIWPEERLSSRSDHYNFARRGIPGLSLFTGRHQDDHRVTDSLDTIDVDQEARILRFVFYLGQEVGNADRRPK